MNYLEIVSQGYFNENNREFLEQYFFREFEKAEKEQFFEANEFFNGCIKVIEGWEKYLQDEVHERKKELYLMLSGAKSGTMQYGDLQGKTIEEKRQETIEYCKQELNPHCSQYYVGGLFCWAFDLLSSGLCTTDLYFTNG